MKTQIDSFERDYYGADFTLKVERYTENGQLRFSCKALEENAGDIEIRGQGDGRNKDEAMLKLYNNLKEEYRAFRLTYKTAKNKSVMTYH